MWKNWQDEQEKGAVILAILFFGFLFWITFVHPSPPDSAVPACATESQYSTC